MKKRTAAVFLLLCLLAASVPGPASAEAPVLDLNSIVYEYAGTCSVGAE